MSFWRENPLELQEEEPQPGWSGLYEPWNGRREETPFDLFPASELYYNTEDSDYEDDVVDHTPDQHEEEQEGGDEDEDSWRSLSPLRLSPLTIEEEEAPLRSLPPLNMSLYPIEEDEEEAPLRTPSPTLTAASPPLTKVNIDNLVPGQDYVVGFMRIPVQSRGRRRRRDEEDNYQEAPPCRRHRVNPVEETREVFIRRSI